MLAIATLLFYWLSGYVLWNLWSTDNNTLTWLLLGSFVMTHLSAATVQTANGDVVRGLGKEVVVTFWTAVTLIFFVATIGLAFYGFRLL